MFEIFSYNNRELKKIKKITNEVLSFEEKIQKLSDEKLKLKTIEFKKRLFNKETLDSLLPEVFAVCREAAYRSIGLKHYPVQIMGGIALHQGRIAEMKTGEGKTLVVTLPAYLNALTGRGVHIVTVNEYLAKRDKEQMENVFKFLGLSTGLIYSNQLIEDKQKAYNCDITYGTNSEFCFDYLKDNLIYSKDRKVQRDLNFCIVDEVDSILIDETRTPLIISSALSKPMDLYKEANNCVKELNADDYVYDEQTKTVWLSDSGVKKVEKFFKIDNLGDLENLRINHHITNALKAHFILKKDINYIIKDNQIIIVDDFTGRLAQGKIYSYGIHQAVESKEGLELHPENQIDGTITYQNYFRMYNKLSGMTGTAKTEEEEFREIYNLDVIEIPTNKPINRIDYNDVIFKTEKEKWNMVIESIKEYHKKKQPILVGTANIEKSELLSNLLKEIKIPHKILNAKKYEEEANIIAQAGRLGSITIATNMAGRGTDILLGGNAMFLANNDFYKKYNKKFDDTICIEEEINYYDIRLKEYQNETKLEKEKVLEVGGLVVLGTERHESRRIDNQLRGRSGRQGEPGKSIFILSLEDDLLRIFGGEKVQSLATSLKLKDNTPITSRFISKIVENSQKKLEGINFETRKNIVKFDDVITYHRKTIYEDRNLVLNSTKIELFDYVNVLVKKQINYLLNLKNQDEKVDLSLVNKNLNILLNTENIQYIEDDNYLETKIKEILHKQIERIDKDKKDIELVLKQNILEVIDTLWREHIENLSELKQGVCLQTYANKNPDQIFKFKSYDLFENLIEDIIFTSLNKIFSI